MILYKPKYEYNKNLVKFARENRNHPTLSEKILWNYLKRNQLRGYDFHRQKPLGNFIYDFYCFELNLLIELDGITHRLPEIQQNDRFKDEYAKQIGFKLMRFEDDEVIFEIEKVILTIEQYIEKFEHI